MSQTTDGKTPDEAYQAVRRLYAEYTAKETRVTLRGLPDALDTAIFVQNKWPMIVDPEVSQRDKRLRTTGGCDTDSRGWINCCSALLRGVGV